MSDFGNRIEEARQRLPLRRLMEQHGKGPANGNWKAFPHCPYCSKKGGVGTFGEGTEERFKCHHASCNSGTSGDGGSWDQVGFLAHELNLNRKDAAITFLKEAGLWQEKEASPSIMPGKAGRKKPLPSETDRGERAEDRDQRSEVRDQRSAPKEEKNLASAAVPLIAAGCNSEGGGSLASQALEASADAPHSETEAGTPTPAGAPPKAVEPVPIERAVEEPPAGQSSPDTNPALSRAGAVSEEDKDSKIPAGGAPPSAESGQSKIVTMTGQPVRSDDVEVVPTTPPNASGGYVIEVAPGQKALEEFFARLLLSEADEKVLFEKRGLDSRTSKALGFRSNPKANKEILQALSGQYSWEDLYAAGLWHREDRKQKKERRPNAKFYGFGIAGKKENGDWEYKWNCPIIIPYFDEQGKLLSLRPHKDMGSEGTLLGTPHVYVPRSNELNELKGLKGLNKEEKTKPEVFEVVVITEGEFKAAALWQILGPFRDDGQPAIGVAALPGISFGRNYEVREELDGWLRRVKCRCVKVIYDNEEKGDAKFPEAFKSERRKRFDAQIWARYLATDLAQKLHIRGEVGMLPNEWRNEKGKADWDGAMAQFGRAA